MRREVGLGKEMHLQTKRNDLPERERERERDREGGGDRCVLVSSFQRVVHVCTGFRRPEDVSLLERCPHFRGWFVQAIHTCTSGMRSIPPEFL